MGRPAIPAGPYLVVGLARSGVAAALALHARGETVIGCDAGSLDLSRLHAVGVEAHPNAAGLDLLDRVRALVKSPGVPAQAAVVVAARDRGLPVLGELELAWRLIPNAWIAVTGTNGKTTTTELLGHIHRLAGRPAVVAGNVGTAACSFVETIDPAATVVCEASSFQLEDADRLRPDVAVLLNLTPDHLDRHGSFDAYARAKLSLFARQGATDVAVLPSELVAGATGAGADAAAGPAGATDAGVDAAAAAGLAIPGGARRVRFGIDADADLREHAGRLWWQGEQLIDVAAIRLRGAHNRRNAMAAASAALARGIEREAVVEALRGFAGVAHRLEELATLGGVLYVNDSKATNVDATLVALASFDAGVHLILGGRTKGGGFTALVEPVRSVCAAVYVIGEATEQILADLAATGVPLHRCEDLERAVAATSAAAVPGEVVLLSPACASFDEYRDFEARGDHFRALVAAAASQDAP